MHPAAAPSVPATPARESPAAVAVAFSGGRDSLALLHATCRAARLLGLTVVALHVHHGLQAEADAWAAMAQALCRRWQRRGWPLRLRIARLTGAPAPGDSLEAWARQGRHAALAQMAREEGAGLLLLAHHRQDQAETVLLQALRGGGPAGLSAMPERIERQGLVWARPWLAQPRRAIEAYVQAHRLKPVEDPSNTDERLARSRLRSRVWPVLAASFADAEQTLAQVARRAQEAQAVLAEVAQADLAKLSAAAALPVPAWLGLSPARRANALRAWLHARDGVLPAESLVQRLLTELPAVRAACWPAGAGRLLRLHRGLLTLAEAAPPVLDAARPLVPGPSLDLSRPGLHAVPGWPGQLEVRAAQQAGVPASLLRALRPCRRTGGERFALAARAQPRSLKLQFQALGVPAHLRDGPLLWAGEQLLFVPGLGLDGRHHAPAGVHQLTLHWHPGRAV